jgi:predicted transcriptional regulator
VKTLTINLEPELEERLKTLAQLEQRSEAEVVLKILRVYTKPEIPDWVGIAASEEALSHQDEEILRREIS